jgi:hypothetical protein
VLGTSVWGELVGRAEMVGTGSIFCPQLTRRRGTIDPQIANSFSLLRVGVAKFIKIRYASYAN